MTLLVVLLLSLADLAASEGHTYGKYYHTVGGENYEDQKYYLYKPAQVPPPGKKLPVIFQVFGSGWILNPNVATRPFSTITPAIQAHNDNGVAFVSTGYRILDRQYWYRDAQGTVKREELIHINSTGKLTLDQQGKTFADYQIQTCFLETMTKCMYDIVEALEHLITHADEYNVDIHRMIFVAFSAGTAEVNYLSFVYHSWNVGRFTPVGMLLAAAQFNLPINCAVDIRGKGIWRDYLEHLEDDSTLSDAVLVNGATPGSWSQGYSWCNQVMECPAFLGLPCNAEWNKATHSRYCSSEAQFNTATVAQVAQTQQYNSSAMDVTMERLWFTGENMLRHTPRPFHIFAHSDMVNWMHHPMYIQQYAEFADRVGINYTVYYNEYKNARQGLPPLQHAKEQELIHSSYPNVPNVHYASSVGWRDEFPAMKSIDPITGAFMFHRPFICLVAGVESCSPTSGSRLYHQHMPDLLRLHHHRHAAVAAIVALGIAMSLILKVTMARMGQRDSSKTIIGAEEDGLE